MLDDEEMILIENIDNDIELKEIMEKYNINKPKPIITGRDVAKMVGMVDVYDKSKKIC